MRTAQHDLSYKVLMSTACRMTGVSLFAAYKCVRLQRCESVPHSVSRQDFPQEGMFVDASLTEFVQKVQMILVRMERVSTAPDLSIL
jgi:hypothetical protein